MLSVAPTLVKILSKYPIRALSAGTNDPIWASSTMRAVWRSKADLPAMFGPVRMMICCFLLSRNMSLGTYSSPAGINVSMTGWRPALMSRVRSLVISGRL